MLKNVKGDREVVLPGANILHPNLRLTIETLNTSGNLDFLDYIF